MGNSNNMEELATVSDTMQDAHGENKILNDVIPSLSSPDKEENSYSAYGSVVVNSEQLISAYIDSRIGGRKENQDSAGFQDTALGAVIVVCDGMGGMNGGQKASSLAVTTILEELSSVTPGSDRKEALTNAIQKANERILSYGNEHPSYAGMGTTVTAIIISDYSVVGAYVGDSRIYQLRGKNKIYRTFDHSMVFEMVKRKVLTEEQARLSAQSNVILKALGVSATVEPDFFEQPYSRGDRFILCTDGFWGAMSEENFIDNASRHDRADQVLADMMQMVDQIGLDAGGNHDNLTASFVDMKHDSKLKEKMNRKSKIIIAALAACLLVSLVFNFVPGKSSQNTDDHGQLTEMTDNEDVEQIVADKEDKKDNVEIDDTPTIVPPVDDIRFGYAMSKENTYVEEGVTYMKLYTVLIKPDEARLVYTKNGNYDVEILLTKESLEIFESENTCMSVQWDLLEGLGRSIGDVYHAEKDNNHYSLVCIDEKDYFLCINDSKLIELNVEILYN